MTTDRRWAVRACGTRRTSSSTTCCNCPTGGRMPLRVRSMVGLIPLFAVEVLEPDTARRSCPSFTRGCEWFLKYRPDLAQLVSRWNEPAQGERHLLSLLRGHRMKRLLRADARRNRVPVRLRHSLAVADATATSRIVFEHATAQKFTRRLRARRIELAACSAAIRTGAARSGCRSITCSSSRCSELHHYYGDDFTVECPVGSGPI